MVNWEAVATVREPQPMSDVTLVLSQIESGDPKAAEQLLPLVYEELRKLAAAKLAHEKPGQTLQATALVHEAYVNLVASPACDASIAGNNREVRPDSSSPHWNSRGHFFAAAAEAMRRILIMSARRRRAEKRGGGRERLELASALLPAIDRDERLLSLEESLSRLEQQHPDKAQVVKLRYFAGLTIADAAAAMGISDTTADRYWSYARAWLQRDMRVEGDAKSR